MYWFRAVKVFSRVKFETVTRRRRKFTVEPVRTILEIAVGFHETSNIHRRFTELCIGTLSLFNLSNNINGSLVNVLATKSEKLFITDSTYKNILHFTQMVSK